MAKLVIYGTGPMAALAHFYFTQDSPHRVVGFTTDRATLTDTRMLGLPVVPFDEVERHFAPAQHAAFVALPEGRFNSARGDLVEEVHAKGYAVASYLSSKAAYWAGLRLEDNCFILENVTIQPFARLGRNVVLWSGSQIGYNAKVDDHAFIGAQAVVSNAAEVGEGSSIGANATIGERVKVGRESVIGAGCLVRTDTLERQVIRDAAALPALVVGKRRARRRRLISGANGLATRVAKYRGNGHIARN